LLRFLTLAALLGLVFALYAALNFDAFKVRAVSVEGVRRLSAEEVREGSGLLGASRLRVRPAAAEARLEQLPYVADARVHGGLSAEPHIWIEERTPAFVWKDPGGMWLVDRSGLVLEQVTRRPGLPMLEVTERRAPRPGERLDPEQVAFVVGLHSRLPADVRAVVDKFTYRPAVGYTINSTAGWQAVIGDATQAAVKAEVLRRLMAREEDLTLVDVSTPAKPYYRTSVPLEDSDEDGADEEEE
jgi:hypothetical protein